MTGICDIEKLIYFSIFYLRNVTAEEILRQLRENIKTDGKNVINVDRNNIYWAQKNHLKEKNSWLNINYLYDSRGKRELMMGVHQGNL